MENSRLSQYESTECQAPFRSVLGYEPALTKSPLISAI